MAQKYITVEELDSGFRFVESKLDGKDSSLEIKRVREKEEFESFEEPRISADRVVVALNSDNSSTIERVLEVERSNPKEDITKGELDRIVFKCLWEFLNEYRSSSYKKLGVTDLDLILAGIDIFGVALDSKRVLDPVGFQAEKISIKLRGSFIPRDLLPLIDHFSSFGDEFRVVENFSVASSFINGDVDFVVHCLEDSTSAFVISDEETKFKEKYDFSLSALVESVREPLEISDKEASAIILKHFSDELSKRMSEFIDDSLRPHLKTLEDLIDDLGKKSDIKINIPEPIFNYALKDKANVERVDYPELLESRGFNIINFKEDEMNLIRNPNYLPLVAYPLFGKHYKDLNKILTRRSKWLVPEK